MTDFQAFHDAQSRALAQWGACPAMSGRGIVTSLYDRDFASGWVLFSEMERLGVSLPIEVWHRPGELSEQHRALVAGLSLNVRFCELRDDVTGWAIKVLALLRSNFREVMWIDTDNVPIRDPEFLFDDPFYRAKGSLFWRDVSGVDRAMRWHPGSPVWSLMGVPYNDCEEFETGQFLFDKQRCWQALALIVHFNTTPGYYEVLHGDKDTFRFAFQKLSRPTRQVNYLEDENAVPFGMMPFGPFHVGAPNPWHKWGGGSVMQQRDRYGKPLFNHRSIDKFTLDSDASGNFRELDGSWELYGPEHEQVYLRHLASLRALLSSAVAPQHPQPSSSDGALELVWLPPVL